MKKRKLFIFVLLFVIMLVPSKGIHAKSQGYYMSWFLKYYKAKDYSKARQNYNQMSKYANEKCVKKMSSKQKKAFKKQLRKFNWYDMDADNYLDQYYYTDIDNDGKADLIVVTGFTAWQKMIVYQYKKGKAIKAGSMTVYHESLYAYPGHKGIVMIHGLDFGERVGVSYLSKGRLKYKSYGGRQLHKNDYFYGHGLLKGRK